MNERGQAAGVGLGSNPTFEFPPGTLEPQLWIGLKSQAFFSSGLADHALRLGPYMRRSCK